MQRIKLGTEWLDSLVAMEECKIPFFTMVARTIDNFDVKKVYRAPYVRLFKSEIVKEVGPRGDVCEYQYTMRCMTKGVQKTITLTRQNIDECGDFRAVFGISIQDNEGLCYTKDDHNKARVYEFQFSNNKIKKFREIENKEKAEERKKDFF